MLSVMLYSKLLPLLPARQGMTRLLSFQWHLLTAEFFCKVGHFAWMPLRELLGTGDWENRPDQSN